MKTKIIIAFIVFAVSGKAQDSTNGVSGPHGGLLKTVENYKIETINSYDCVTAYLFDKTLNVIPNKFISGTIMFFYNNEARLNNYLVPSGQDSFTADVPNIYYSYYIIRFNVNGKFISGRFNGSSGLVERDNKKALISH